MLYPNTKNYMLVWKHRKLKKSIEIKEQYCRRYEITEIGFDEESKEQTSITEYDTKEELLKDLEIISQMMPVDENTELNEYICLDFVSEKVFKYSIYKSQPKDFLNYGYYRNTKPTRRLYESMFSILVDKGKLDSPRVRDILFRREDEVPKNYKWDDGEYEGWLRFRWGDGKNAIKPKDNNQSPKKEKKVVPIETLTIAEEIELEYEREEEIELKKKLIDRW